MGDRKHKRITASRGRRGRLDIAKRGTAREYDAAILIADLRDALEKVNASNEVLRANAQLFRARFERVLTDGTEPASRNIGDALIWGEVIRAEGKLPTISRAIDNVTALSSRLYEIVYASWLETQALARLKPSEIVHREEKAAQTLREVTQSNFQAVIAEIKTARAYIELLLPAFSPLLRRQGEGPAAADLLSRMVIHLGVIADEHAEAVNGARSALHVLTDPNVEDPSDKSLRRRPSQRLEKMRVILEGLKPERVTAAIRDATAATSDFSRWIRSALDEPSRSVARHGPKVSIVLPVYNHAHFMEEAVGSVLAQTYGNWELIIVDDGSHDDVARIVSKYSGERRLVLLRQENQKLPAALNNGFHFATGEYLTWTSADNVMLPNQIARLVRSLVENPNAGLVYSDYWAIDDRGRPLEDLSWRRQNRDFEFPDLIRLPDARNVANLHQEDNFVGASFMYRREVANIVGRYSENMFGGEDYDYWLRMRIVTRFTHIAKPLYRYRVHDDTLTARAKSLGQKETILRLLDEDRWRIGNLLAAPTFGEEEGDLLRPIDQFRPALLERLSIHRLSQELPWQLPDEPVLIDVDVPARRIDPGIAGQADLLLCRDELAAAILRRASWARQARVLRWDGTVTDEVKHAFVQAIAERASGARDRKPRRLPALDPSFYPRTVLFLVQRWSTGGLENVVADLARGLAARDIAVIVATAQGAPPPNVFSGGIRTVQFDDDAEAFGRFLSDERIDLVSAHHTIFGIPETRRARVPYIYTMHNSYLWFDEIRLKQWSSGLAAAAHVIAVSPQVAQFAVARLGIEPRKLSVIPNLIDLSSIRDPGPRRIGKGRPFTVVALGSFNRVKLQHVLVSAFEDAHAAYPDMRLSLIGAPFDQAYFDEVSRQVENSPVRAGIDIVPGLSHAEALKRLSTAHVFSLASALEGWSVALMEAVASGCVCIASEVGGVPMLGSEAGAIITIPSPLGELESITAVDFDKSLRSSLPDHRANLAAALKRAREDYENLAAQLPVSKHRLTKLCDRGEVLTDWLRQHVLSGRDARFG